MAETPEQTEAQEVIQPTYTEMTFSASQVKSIDVLVRGIQVAQRRGAFNLQESSSLNDAFKEIIPGYEAASSDDAPEQEVTAS